MNNTGLVRSQLPSLEPRSNYINPQTPHRKVRALQPGEIPARGAHLLTPWLGFAHHGIYAGDGRVIPTGPIPNRYDQVGLLFDWVEKGVAPGMSVPVTAGEKSLPLCSYPTYPKYRGGPAAAASSYACSAP